MKKFLIFVIFMIAFIAINEGEEVYSLNQLEYDGVYSCYAQGVSDCVPSFINVVSSGSGKIISTNSDDACDIKDYVKGEVYGESICIKGTYDDFLNITKKMNIKVVMKEQFDNLTSIYGFGRFGESVCVNGKLVNIQIAYSGDYIVIGCPVILGSY